MAGTLAGLVLFGVSASAHADTTNDRKRELDQEIAQLRDELEGTSAEFAEAAVTLKRSEAGLAEVRAELGAARDQVARAQRQDAQVASRLAYARAEEVKAQRELRDQQRARNRAQTAIGLIARQSYVDSGMTGLALALKTDDPDQFVDRLAVAGTALQSQTGAIRRLAVQEAELRTKRTTLTAVRAEVAELKERSAALLRTRQEGEKKAAAAEITQAGLVAEQTAALAVIDSKAEEEKARLREMEAEQRKLKEQLSAEAVKEAGQNSGSSATVSGGLLHPVDSPITSPFGLRYHPILHIWRLHTGVDFGASCGTPVRASASGRVISTGWAGGYGNRVVISHGRTNGGSLATTYSHLSRIVIRSGSVARGQVVAYVGTTGLSTGCHLHYETLLNGSYVNPSRYL
jgi:murein DD-endopeptidase MepM/ murein hydrolase activator NlpD